jgi:hypothetical protein
VYEKEWAGRGPVLRGLGIEAGGDLARPIDPARSDFGLKTEDVAGLWTSAEPRDWSSSHCRPLTLWWNLALINWPSGLFRGIRSTRTVISRLTAASTDPRDCHQNGPDANGYLPLRKGRLSHSSVSEIQQTRPTVSETECRPGRCTSVLLGSDDDLKATRSRRQDSCEPSLRAFLEGQGTEITDRVIFAQTS